MRCSNAHSWGIEAVLKEITLWVLASRLEEVDEKSIRARALLEKVCLVNLESDVLQAETVRFEEHSGAPAKGGHCLHGRCKNAQQGLWILKRQKRKSITTKKRNAAVVRNDYGMLYSGVWSIDKSCSGPAGGLKMGRVWRESSASLLCAVCTISWLVLASIGGKSQSVMLTRDVWLMLNVGIAGTEWGSKFREKVVGLQRACGAPMCQEKVENLEEECILFTQIYPFICRYP